MIQQSTFEEALEEFDRQESHPNFFDLASRLMNGGYRIQAYLLLLATWNFARFRYAVKEFNIGSFEETIQRLEPDFDSLEHLTIATANLDDYRQQITSIFQTLSKVKGVEYTGASKLMQLRNPALFVMWDGYIRGEKSKKLYAKLPIVQSHEWELRRYTTSADSYFEFLKDMQARFRHLVVPDQEKTLAKAIDEFNYVRITLPIQTEEKPQGKTNMP
jgi:hypothetical protein